MFFLTSHTQLGTRRLFSGRLFNCVASRKAIYTNTHIHMCMSSLQMQITQYFPLYDIITLAGFKLFCQQKTTCTLPSLQSGLFVCLLTTGYSQDQECWPSLIISRYLGGPEALMILRMFCQIEGSKHHISSFHTVFCGGFMYWFWTGVIWESLVQRDLTPTRWNAHTRYKITLNVTYQHLQHGIVHRHAIEQGLNNNTCEPVSIYRLVLSCSVKLIYYQWKDTVKYIITLELFTSALWTTIS